MDRNSGYSSASKWFQIRLGLESTPNLIYGWNWTGLGSGLVQTRFGSRCTCTQPGSTLVWTWLKMVWIWSKLQSSWVWIRFCVWITCVLRQLVHMPVIIRKPPQVIISKHETTISRGYISIIIVFLLIGDRCVKVLFFIFYSFIILWQLVHDTRYVIALCLRGMCEYSCKIGSCANLQIALWKPPYWMLHDSLNPMPI